jgi:hypothetical protein
MTHELKDMEMPPGQMREKQQKSNRRSFDSAKVRFAQDDSSFLGG